MTKTFLAVAIISLSNPAIAAGLKVGDVLYCTSDYFYGSDVDNLNNVVRYKTQNFKLRVSDSSLVFGSSGYFSETTIPVVEFQPWKVIAKDEFSNFQLGAYSNNISFNYASANPFGMALIKGTCDKF